MALIEHEVLDSLVVMVRIITLRLKVLTNAIRYPLVTRMAGVRFPVRELVFFGNLLRSIYCSPSLTIGSSARRDALHVVIYGASEISTVNACPTACATRDPDSLHPPPKPLKTDSVPDSTLDS